VQITKAFTHCCNMPHNSLGFSYFSQIAFTLQLTVVLDCLIVVLDIFDNVDLNYAERITYNTK